ncbi:MAG: SDR family oxidoreductase [Nitrososphaeraceae archaeon]
MAETILITGASGTVGSEVVKQLSNSTSDINIKAAGHSVKSVTSAIKSDDRVEPIEIDYNKADTLRQALNEVEKLFLLTPFQSDMVELSSNLLKEIENTGNIKHIVKLSVMGADAEPGITGGRLHRQVEKMIEESGIPFTFLRPNFFMQNFVSFLSQTIREQGAFYLPAEAGKVSFVDIRDIAAVAVQVLVNNNDTKHNGRAYTITGPEAISYEDAARILSEQVGKKISYVNISEEQAREGMKAIGMGEWLINSMMELYSITRMGYVSQISSAVDEVTGRMPISFNQFGKDYAQAFR